ncbi:MAG: hypothetical protein U1E70_19050 [Acetobacteraceae bacterium]|nr:hypothetical protein [Pseudomonadota bacterium]
MTVHRLGDGQQVTVGADAWNGDSLRFTGTTNGALPAVTFAGDNMLKNVRIAGTESTPYDGAINQAVGAEVTIDHLALNHGTLFISQRPTARTAFEDDSSIRHGSTLTATGYSGQGQYVVNGTMTIDGTSTVNMDYVAVSGTGTFHLTGPQALLRAGSVSADETVQLDSGKLSLVNGMSFLGTITDSQPCDGPIGADAQIAVYNATRADHGTFNAGSGLLDLYDSSGAEVVALRFAPGGGDLYAAPTTGQATNYLQIASHPLDGSIPIDRIA